MLCQSLEYRPSYRGASGSRAVTSACTLQPSVTAGACVCCSCSAVIYARSVVHSGSTSIPTMRCTAGTAGDILRSGHLHVSYLHGLVTLPHGQMLRLRQMHTMHSRMHHCRCWCMLLTGLYRTATARLLWEHTRRTIVAYMALHSSMHHCRCWMNPPVHTGPQLKIRSAL
jgi:hypothetical protein